MVKLANGFNTVAMPTYLVNSSGSSSNPSTIAYNDTSTNLAGNATFTGTARDTGIVSGVASTFEYFNAFAYADQAGTFSIEGSWDNATWTKLATGAITASTPLTLQIPVMFRYHRVKLVNGAAAQGTVQISSAYTAA